MTKNNWVMITGASGFIGSHLTEELIRQGFRVRALVHYHSNGTKGWLNQLPKIPEGALDIVRGDIRDPLAVRKAMEGCTTVFHLAALIAIPYSYISPESFVETNVRGTLNLLQAAREVGVQRFVQTSSSEVYGTARIVPMTEEHPLMAQSPYAATKIAADQLALSFHRSFGLPVTVVRPFNTFGPRQSSRAVIPAIILQLLSGKTDLVLGSIHTTRDFNYVKDTVQGFIAAAECPMAIGEVLNVGRGHEISVEQTARLIGNILGKIVNFVVDPARLRPKLSEVERLLASNEKISRLTNWKPNYGDEVGFKNALVETIDWFRNPNNQRLYDIETYQI